MDTPDIIIYTDGSALGNPGPGGYGVVLISGQHRKELSEGFARTTNNRMELLAVIKGLETLKKPESKVTIYTDSRYVADSVNKRWVFDWVKKNFKDKKNKDLWLRFLKIYPKHHISINWVKGHNNNKENERCDRLAVAAASNNPSQKDTGYVENDTADLLNCLP